MNEDEWDEILRRFREEGLDTDLPDNRKLLYVWRWLVDAETNCISLRHQLDKLSRRQADELREIRSCMEQMCNSWEIKVSKLEEENKRFQNELDLTGQNSGKIVGHEIRQMVLGEGLSDIVDLSVVEQIAYFLDERSRLRTKLDHEIAARRKCEQLIRISPNLPDCLKLSSPYIQRILDHQKDEYEEEIRHQQEAMKQVKEQLKQVHEDEIQRLNSQKENLTSELSKTSEKLQELVTQMSNQQGKDTTCLPWVQSILDGTYDKEMKDIKTEQEELRSLCRDQQKQMKEQCEALRILERTNKQLELDNETLAFKLSEALAQFDELEDQLRREATRVRRESLFKQLAAKESTNVKNNINKFLDGRTGNLDPAMTDQVNKLKDESSSLRMQLETSKKQLELMSLKYQQHKERYRDKIYRLRDLQDQEHSQWKERLESCEKELAILREMLAREQEWRVQVEADCRKLKDDNQVLRNGILEKEKPDKEKQLDVGSLHREVDLIKAASRPHSLTNSPARRHSVWPVVAQPKNW